MGEINARLQYRAEEETPVIGPYFVGRGEEFALQSAEGTQANRELLSVALRDHELPPMNTYTAS